MVHEETPVPVPREPDVDENGVDLAQIRAMLEKKPGERLILATAFMNSLATVRDRNGIRRSD